MRIFLNNSRAQVRLSRGTHVDTPFENGTRYCRRENRRSDVFYSIKRQPIIDSTIGKKISVLSLIVREKVKVYRHVGPKSS
jgi:hypothetical protein